jgi:hypothetical protein
VLYKGKGDKSDPNNYRGITLKSHLLKLLESVICARFVAWLEKHLLLPMEQLAYRRGLSGADHLFTLHGLREGEIRQGKTLFTGFLDLRKAFPSIDRDELIQDLVTVGVSRQTVSRYVPLTVGRSTWVYGLLCGCWCARGLLSLTNSLHLFPKRPS